MQVEICGTVQVVPDNFDLSNKPWVKVINETKKIKQGSKLQLGDDRNVYVVTFIPVGGWNRDNWRAYAIDISTGNRWDEGVKINGWQHEIDLPEDWKE